MAQTSLYTSTVDHSPVEPVDMVVYDGGMSLTRAMSLMKTTFAFPGYVWEVHQATLRRVVKAWPKNISLDIAAMSGSQILIRYDPLTETLTCNNGEMALYLLNRLSVKVLAVWEHQHFMNTLPRRGELRLPHGVALEMIYDDNEDISSLLSMVRSVPNMRILTSGGDARDVALDLLAHKDEILKLQKEGFSFCMGSISSLDYIHNLNHLMKGFISHNAGLSYTMDYGHVTSIRIFFPSLA